MPSEDALMASALTPRFSTVRASTRYNPAAFRPVILDNVPVVAVTSLDVTQNLSRSSWHGLLAEYYFS